jgi:hypothetical protein
MNRASFIVLLLVLGSMSCRARPAPYQDAVIDLDAEPVQVVTPEASAQEDFTDAGCVPWNWEHGCLPSKHGDATGPGNHVEAGAPELSRYGTVFDPIDGRTKNIQTASDKINGYVIEPGKVFSFNDVVGIRTSKAGYLNAPVLLQGRRTDDLGGGVCQVSSTLHAAAVEGGLVIVERRPHSLVPKYIEPGYDATVSFPASCEIKDAPCGKLDLKIKNPFEVPVTIRAVVSSGEVPGGEIKGHLNVVLEGLRPDFVVDIKRQTEPMGRGGRRWVRSGKVLSADYVKVVQQQGPGYFVRTTAKYSKDGATVREYKWFSRYPPVDEVWEVGYARPADAGDPW